MGDVLAHLPISTGGGPHQPTCLVLQYGFETIDLMLCHKRERLISHIVLLLQSCRTGYPLLPLGPGKHITKRPLPDAVLDLSKRFCWGGTNGKHFTCLGLAREAAPLGH